MQHPLEEQEHIVTDIRPPADACAIVRKLGAMTLLSEAEIEFLEGLHNNKITVAAGSDFVKEGEDFKATFFVMSGWAIRYALTESGRRQILSYALPGDILGLHINFRRTASYSAAALSEAELAVVDPLRTIEISQKYPVLAAGMSWCTAREFAILGDQAVRLGRLTADQRLAHLLLELWYRLRLIGEVHDSLIRMPMTQNDLADTLGLSLVHINRQLRTLKNQGLISIGRKWVRLNDVEKLTELSEFNPQHLAEFRV